MDIDLLNDPLGTGSDGQPVYLRDIWPDASEIDDVVLKSIESDMFRTSYDAVYAGDERWNSLAVPTGDSYEWDNRSTYVRHPPYFEGMSVQPEPLSDVRGARVLAKLADSVTTDHISPAGSIKADGPAGRWLVDGGVEPGEFNSRARAGATTR